MNKNWVRLLFVAAVFSQGSIQGATAKDLEPEYTDIVRTLSGKVYRDVNLVKVDPNGLLFRHRSGIAKVTFDNLEEGFREFYNYDKAKAEEFEKARGGAGKPVPKARARAGNGNAQVAVVNFRTRTYLPSSYRHPYADAWSACSGTPWYSHWARFHPGLAYARFPCRQLAERDFLISSGIVPVPPGVTVRRVLRSPRVVY